MLTFDEQKHEYRWNGAVVPSVTQVLRPLTNYGMIPEDKLEIARQKGTAVHKMVELHAKGDLDVETLPDWMRPVLVQWEKFVADTSFEMLESEFRVYHAIYGYAGTLDLFGVMKRVGDAAFIDVKRSFFAGGVIGMQLSGYQEAFCYQQKVGKHAMRYALKLNESGPYRLERYSNPKSDFGNFLTALAFHRLQEKHR